MKKSRLIAYVGPFSFPAGGAAARRILGISQSLRESGFEVVVACGQNSDSYEGVSYEGFQVVSLAERDAEHLARIFKHLSYINMGKKTIAWLDSLPEKPFAVILYSGYSPYLLKLIPWARRNNVRLVFDAVEWYDADSFFRRFSPYHLNIEFAMRWLLPKALNIIAISKYLKDYYKVRGCQCIVVPPTLDLRSITSRVNSPQPAKYLSLAYAGSPGKKDLLNNILEAVFRISASGHNVRLVVAGIPASHAMNYEAVRRRTMEEVAACVDFKGVLNHSNSVDLVRNADFSLLLRRDARYSRAGFPTKFVESMAVGTPVIANITSDLGQYLFDGETGIVCKGPNPEDLESGLLRALRMCDEERELMRIRCRESAIRDFDFRGFSLSLSDFINSARV